MKVEYSAGGEHRSPLRIGLLSTATSQKGECLPQNSG